MVGSERIPLLCFLYLSFKFGESFHLSVFLV